MRRRASASAESVCSSFPCPVANLRPWAEATAKPRKCSLQVHRRHMSSHNGSSRCAFPRTCSTPVPVPPGCRTDMTISKPSLIPIEAVGIKKAASSAQTIQPSTTRPAPMIADHSPAQICTGERALQLSTT